MRNLQHTNVAKPASPIPVNERAINIYIKDDTNDVNNTPIDHTNIPIPANFNGGYLLP